MLYLVNLNWIEMEIHSVLQNSTDEFRSGDIKHQEDEKLTQKMGFQTSGKKQQKQIYEGSKGRINFNNYLKKEGNSVGGKVGIQYVFITKVKRRRRNLFL